MPYRDGSTLGCCESHPMTAAIASCARCGRAICEECADYVRMALHCGGCAARRVLPRLRAHRLWSLAAFAPALIAAALIGLMLYVGPTRHLRPGDFRKVAVSTGEEPGAAAQPPGVRYLAPSRADH
jgi:hypothetical protein